MLFKISVLKDFAALVTELPGNHFYLFTMMVFFVYCWVCMLFLLESETGVDPLVTMKRTDFVTLQKKKNEEQDSENV